MVVGSRLLFRICRAGLKREGSHIHTYNGCGEQVTVSYVTQFLTFVQQNKKIKYKFNVVL